MVEVAGTNHTKANVATLPDRQAEENCERQFVLNWMLEIVAAVEIQAMARLYQMITASNGTNCLSLVVSKHTTASPMVQHDCRGLFDSEKQRAHA